MLPLPLIPWAFCRLISMGRGMLPLPLISLDILPSDHGFHRPTGEPKGCKTN